MLRTWLVLLLAAALLPSQSPLQFTDQTLASGLAWQQVDTRYLMGAGGAFVDIDGDGFDDIVLVGGDSAPALYRNLGNGSFVDVSAQLQRGPTGPAPYAMSVSVADVDNDGDADLYLGYHGPNQLLLNDGLGNFTLAPFQDAAGQAWTSGAAFADFDGDGYLDLYVGNYIAVLSFPLHTPATNRLYRNLGGGRFEDWTARTGTGLAGTTLAVSFSDLDQDGDPDLLVGNDFGAFIEPNRWFRNDGPTMPPGSWRFTEVATGTPAGAQLYCMGIAPGDIDRDGDLDLYFTNLGRNLLLENQNGRTPLDGLAFRDITTATGTENTFDPTTANPNLFATSWGCAFEDLDLDGWLDLYVVNGHIPAAPNIANGLATPCALFHHDGPGLTFTERGAQAGAGHQGVGRGLATSDYDRDGDVDLLVINVAGRPALLRNDSPRRGHHLVLDPVGVLGNRDGAGVRVTLDMAAGPLVREARNGDSFEAARSRALHFGLGSETVVPRATASWPRGFEQEVFGLPVDGRFLLIEPSLEVATGSHLPPLLREGDTGTLTVRLRNHHDMATSGWLLLTIHEAGQAPVVSPFLPVLVPGQDTLTLNFATTLPVGSVGGTARALTVEVSVLDARGGLDQWRRGVILAP